jgi:hypothetical protein
MKCISNAIIFICLFLVVAVCIEGFNASNKEAKEKDTWILRCMIGLDRTAADCEVYYRVMKDYQDDKQP